MKNSSGSTTLVLITGLLVLVGAGVLGYKYHTKQEIILQKEIEMDKLVGMIIDDADHFPEDGDHAGHMERMSYILDQYAKVKDYKRELCRRYPEWAPYFMDLHHLWRMLDRFKNEESS